MTKKMMIKTADVNSFRRNKNTNKIFYVICMLFYAFYANGKVFNGRIINEKGSPISNVVVINITKTSADYTNEEGYFTIQANKGDSLLIYQWGYDEMKYVLADMNQDIKFAQERSSFSPHPEITDDQISLIDKLYYAEKYKDCVAYCMYYLGSWHTNIHYYIQSQKHPYQSWGNYRMHWLSSSDPLKYAELCFIGALSAFEYIGSIDFDMLVNGCNWSMSCVAIIEDYLQVTKPMHFWTADMMYNYIIYGQQGMNASEMCRKFIGSLGKDLKWLHNERWLEKKSDKILDFLYKNVSDKESYFSNYPLLRYEISKISIDYVVMKRNYRHFYDTYTRYCNNAIELILQRREKYDVAGFRAINLLTSLLKKSIIDEKFRKKSPSDFLRNCMEQLTKLQDISYFLNGSSVYTLSYNYTLNDIQNRLGENDCAIIMFERLTTDELLTALHKFVGLGTPSVVKDYALMITKKQDNPEFFELPLLNLSPNHVVEEYIKTIKSKCPSAKRLYFVGTPRMSFIDVAGNDSSIVRLHSLSQLLQDRNSTAAESEITFIGDLNYKKVGTVSPSISVRKGGDFGQLKGPAKELAYINTLFSNVRPICGDDATRNVVTSEISRSKGIIHISTHGELFSPSDDFTPEELILKKNVMENSCLILSGYNDTPHSSLCYMSGSDVLKIKHINSEVVFLDACMLGKGAVSVSGSVGMAEAFHLIGAKNVICYLEPVKDIVATEFSNRFYLELSKGASCHDAFFRAKKSIKQNLKVVLWE